MLSIDRADGCLAGLRNSDYSVVYSNEASVSLTQVAENGAMNFSIYPMPANDRINIQFEDNSTGTTNLKISDISGRVVYSKDFGDARPQAHSIDSSTLAEGMYLLHVFSSGKRSTKKIVVLH